MQSTRNNAGFSFLLECCDAAWPCSTCGGQAAIEFLTEPEVLILAEDDEFAQDMGTILQEQGCQVYLAPDVQTALDELGNYNFDLLIIQAGRDNFAALEAARQAKQREHPVKVMVISAPRSQGFPLEAFELDVDDYLMFPFSTGELGRRVAALLSPGEPAWGGFSGHSSSDLINARVMESLRLLMAEIRSSLVKAGASLEAVNRSAYGPLDQADAAVINEVLDHIARTIGLTEDFHRKSSHSF